MRPVRFFHYVPAAILTAVLTSVALEHSYAQGGAPTAKPSAKPPVVITDPLGTAAALIDRGQYAQAAILLDAIDQLPTADRAKFDANERAFLRGRIAFGRGDYKTAIRYYEAILVNKPGVVRVRLELARSLMMDGQYDRAERNFEFVLAGDVPKNVAANVNRFLDEIYAQRTWRFRFNFALAPDTNINTATNSTTVDIFGLPFSLADNARRKSGVGIFASGGVEYRPKLSDTTRLLTNFQAQRTEYKSSDFDDTIVSTSIGPEMTYGQVVVGVAGTGFRRWYGTGGYNWGAGAEFDLNARLTGIFGVGFTLLAEDVHYDQDPAHNGPLLSGVLSGVFGLTPASSLRLWAGLNREFASADFEKNTAYRVGFNYYREFPWGITATLSPDFVLRPFDAIHPAFGVKRNDTLYEVDLQLLKRDFKIFGFAPYFDYTFSHNASNVAIYRFSRNRFGFGFTRLY